MMMKPCLQHFEIFELKPLITNLSSKLSTVTEYDAHKQLLCLVSDENDIVFRYTNESGLEVLKLISWFRRTNRVIHDVCFDPTGTWLLVLCFDNTLHIVPALWVVDKSTTTSLGTYPQQPYSTTQVTSYIIPFVGPHECPNSKKCPNHNTSIIESTAAKTNTSSSTAATQSAKLEQQLFDLMTPKSKEEEQVQQVNQQDCALSANNNCDAEFEVVFVPLEDDSVDVFSSDVPLNMLAHNTATATKSAHAASSEDKSGNQQIMGTSFMASQTCPYPLSVAWWQTIEGLNRAIIGYSDGSICFVGLSPNCPFVASTAIETDSGSVMKLLICKDNTYESVMLLITSTLKQQYKLLLEQKAIKYTYPGDISPSLSQARDNDWQIVMPLKSNSNCSDPASDSSQLEEDVFLKNDEVPTTITRPSHPPPPHPVVATTQNQNSVPPPPPYVNRTSYENASTAAPTTSSSSSSSSGVRFQQQQLPASDFDDINGRAGILPAARARLASLKSLGSKKLNAIKMRLSDNRQKLEEYMPENTLGTFTIMDSPSLTPEVLSNTMSSFYRIQNLRSTYLLSALHSQTNTLSVHSIDINLKPLFLYKIPANCCEILISSNILYSIQYVDLEETKGTTCNETEGLVGNEDEINSKIIKDVINHVLEMAESDGDNDGGICHSVKKSVGAENNLINAVAVISSAMASLRSGVDDNFNNASQLGLFRFENETVLNLYQLATYRTTEPNETISKEDKTKAFNFKEIRSPLDYVQFYESLDVQEEYSLRQMEIMKNEFPKINYDPCYVVTNKNVYYIQLKKEPFAIFLDSALASEWSQCHEFCNTFDLCYEACIEFAGDYLLRRKKVAQALLTYNTARIKPIRTALKLAMFGQTYTLMHLCAMALKSTYLLKSQYFCNPIIKTLLDDITYRHSEDVRLILPQRPAATAGVVENEGASCSDYVYGIDESISQLQMSPSSQFHLANLLLITLAEKAVNDKNYLPLWNFLVTNSKFHTNMTSIVLCQSGLFSAALILTKVRGVCIDTFVALTSVVGQEFGWYSELNVCLYNLSETLFTESITYLPHISVDYFVFIQEKLDNIRDCVLKRLEQQLNPFSATLRPIVTHTSSWRFEQNSNDNKTFLFDFCKTLIETYLAVLIHMESQRSKRENVINALSSFRLTYEDNQFAIETARFKPISAGCAHCACVVDGVAYFWGSNGVPCNYNVNKVSDPPEPPHAVKCLEVLMQLNLEVHAVKCGRQHTLVLTNNGLYSIGNNNLMQLGIGSHMLMSLQPMLVKALDGKNITVLEAGQYHNAAVADGLLYTWGWGVYGQLGHDDTENVPEPKLVSFFKYKKVIQVSLGHAHSLVLCQGQHSQSHTTELYVFGSNHFGQLGINAPAASSMGASVDAAASGVPDVFHCATLTKSLVPIKLEFGSNERIRLIHTKFFSNLAVDDNEQMYTWGSSPQALRLANQIKRRANAKQKVEENQRREISRRFEATISYSEEGADAHAQSTSDDSDDTTTLADAAASLLVDSVSALKHAITKENIAKTESCPKVNCNEANSIDNEENYSVEQNATDGIASVLPTSSSETENLAVIEDVDELLEQKPFSDIDDVPIPCTATTISQEPSEELEQKDIQLPQQKQPCSEIDLCEHMTPHLVDTSEIAGKIKQVSSGLFHFALISSSCTLYTWGKNLEHQLGTGDKERRAVNKPSPIDSIESPMFVDCGADFTLVMSTDYVVKAFGGNSNGQCGRDLGASIDKLKQRVVCLPTTKRLMRFESQCVEIPVEINLPRPCIRLDNEPVRYLKSIPKFQPHFVQEAGISFFKNCEQPSPSQYCKSTMSDCDCDENVQQSAGQDSDDMISSLENLSNNESSINSEFNPTPAVKLVMSTSVIGSVNDQSCSCEDFSPEEQSYAPLLLTDNVETQGYLADIEAVKSQPTEQLESQTYTVANQKDKDDNNNELCAYIHYCLYIFHGLYNPEKIRDFSKQRLEYRIRTNMLNFKFVDAFTLCLHVCDTAHKSLKIFEYFTKDTSFVPMRRPDLKYFIYFLLKHFIERSFDLLLCERFFLIDLDYYLLELAYVLYFNNNNTLLEKNLNQKFKNLISAQDPNQNNENEYRLGDTDSIFDSLSVKFKSIVCQRLLKRCNN